MNPDWLRRRIIRRETHSPRSSAAIVLATILILVFAWIGTECVLAAFGAPALLVAPADGVRAIARLPVAAQTAVLVAAGTGVAAIGLALTVYGILPGRRARHTMAGGRSVAFVDDCVIASFLAQCLAHQADLDPSRVAVGVSHRSARVRIRPSSGYPVDRQAAAETADAELDKLGALPRMRCRVTLDREGTVGA